MRKLFGWMVGIVVFLGVGLALMWAGNALGVPSSIELDGPVTITHGGGRYSYDEETDSLQTTYGLMTGALAGLIGIWAGQAAHARRWNAGFTAEGQLSIRAWLMALTILCVLSALTQLAFRGFIGQAAGYVKLAIEAGGCAGVAWACHQWWKNRRNSLQERNNAE